MSLPRRAARAMLAVPFVTGGLDQLRDPQPKREPSRPVIAPLADRIGPLPKDPEQVIRLDGAIKVAAGLGMVFGGPLARPCALVLAGSLVPTTLAGHRWWQRQDPQVRESDKVHFGKNVAMLGGLLITALDTGGRPSVPWMAGKAARTAAAAVGGTAGAAAETAGTVGGTVTNLAGAVGSGVAHGAGALASGAAGAAAKAAEAAAVVKGAKLAGTTAGKAGKAAVAVKTGKAVSRRVRAR